jgi:hypothetical protein
MGPYYSCFWPVMDARCPLQARNVHNMCPKCVWATSISFEEKMDQAMGRQEKKKATGSSFVLSALRTVW